jgi:hypothetical protein
MDLEGNVPTKVPVDALAELQVAERSNSLAETSDSQDIRQTSGLLCMGRNAPTARSVLKCHNATTR